MVFLNNIKIVLADFRKLNADFRRSLFDCSCRFVLFNKDIISSAKICGNLQKNPIGNQVSKVIIHYFRNFYTFV